MSQPTQHVPLLRCPDCRGPLGRQGSVLSCEDGHRWPGDGVVWDLCRSEAPSARKVFDGAWGAIYTKTMAARWYSVAISPVWQGASMAIMRQMFALMDEAKAALEVGDVLDVPCGGGAVVQGASVAARHRYVGVDLSRRQLHRAAGHVRRAGIERSATLLRADARDLPVADGAVATACSFNGLHLIEERRRVLAEIVRCIRPGGTLVGSTLVDFDRPATRHLFPWFFCLSMARPHTRTELEEDLESVGLLDVGIRRSGPVAVFRARKPSVVPVATGTQG